MEIFKEIEKLLVIQKSIEKAKLTLDKTYTTVKRIGVHQINEQLDRINKDIVKSIHNMTDKYSDHSLVHIVGSLNSNSTNSLCDMWVYQHLAITFRDYVDSSKKYNVCQECIDNINSFKIEIVKMRIQQRLDEDLEYVSNHFDNLSFREWNVKEYNISSNELKEWSEQLSNGELIHKDDDETDE